MYKAFLKILLLALILISVEGYAQRAPIPTVNFNIHNGLSQSSGRAILKDQEGFFWFATKEGLNRYDGKNIKVFKHEPKDESSILNHFINCLYEYKGKIWIGTMRGLSCYNPKTESFTNYAADITDMNKLMDNDVMAIIGNDKGELWVASSDGLHLMNIENGTFKRFVPDADNPKMMNDKNISSIIIDKDDHLWMSSRGGGVMIYDHERFYNLNMNSNKGIANNYLHKIYQDKAGKIWVGTDGGLQYINLKDTSFVSIPFKHKQAHEGLSISTIHEDSEGNLWIGTNESGLWIYSREEKKFVQHTNQHKFITRINDAIYDIYSDSLSGIWVGTFLNGIYFFDYHSSKFEHYLCGYPSGRYNSVYGICKDSDGYLWAGTDGGGLTRINEKTNEIKTFKYHPHEKGCIQNNNILCVYEDSKKRLWIGTFEGLHLYNKKNETFKNYLFDKSDRDAQANRITSIYEDAQKQIWLGTHGEGLYLFDDKKGIIKRNYRSETDNSASISNDFISFITEDDLGDLWIGSYYGLNQFNPTEEVFTRYLHDIKKENTLNDISAMSFYKDINGIMWIGTNSGVNKFNPEFGTFESYSTEDGLGNGKVLGISGDETGNIWMSTNYGVSMFNPKSKKFTNYTSRDGLQSNEFNITAYYKDLSGKIYFGGINGITAFYPKDIKVNHHIPPIAFTNLRINNKSIAVPHQSTLSLGEDNTLPSIDLPYGKHMLQFEFAALNYSSPLKNSYAFMLDGYDDGWNYLGNKNTAAYYNLKPGDYKLIVNASNNDTQWNKDGIELPIHIEEPWWMGLWFKLGLAGFIILIILISILLRRRRKLIYKEELEITVRHRTRSLKEKAEKLQDQKDRLQQELDKTYE